MRAETDVYIMRKRSIQSFLIIQNQDIIVEFKHIITQIKRQLNNACIVVMLRDNLCNKVRNIVRNKVRNIVRNRVRNKVRNIVRNKVRNIVRTKVRNINQINQ